MCLTQVTGEDNAEHCLKGKKKKKIQRAFTKPGLRSLSTCFHLIYSAVGAGNKTSLPAGVTACPQNSNENGLSGCFSRLEELSTHRRSTKLYPLEEKLATIQKGIADWEVVKPVEPVQKDFTGGKILHKSIRTNRTSMNTWCSWNYVSRPYKRKCCVHLSGSLKTMNKVSVSCKLWLLLQRCEWMLL